MLVEVAAEMAKCGPSMPTRMRQKWGSSALARRRLMGSVEQYNAAAIAYQGPFPAGEELMNVICVIHTFVGLKWISTIFSLLLAISFSIHIKFGMYYVYRCNH